jgi:hypothetical protein
MTIAELLEWLKVADPEAYHEIEEFYLVRNVATDVDYVSDEWGHHSNLSIPDEWENDIIQGCIQQAIKEHEWELTQVQHGKWDRPQPCFAAIKKAPMDNWISGFGDTPAEAILSAYIAALEAMGCK